MGCCDSFRKLRLDFSLDRGTNGVGELSTATYHKGDSVCPDFLGLVDRHFLGLISEIRRFLGLSFCSLRRKRLIALATVVHQAT